MFPHKQLKHLPRVCVVVSYEVVTVSTHDSALLSHRVSLIKHNDCPLGQDTFLHWSHPCPFVIL